MLINIYVSGNGWCHGSNCDSPFGATTRLECDLQHQRTVSSNYCSDCKHRERISGQMHDMWNAGMSL